MLFFIIKQEALELLIHHNGLCRQDKHRQGMNVPANVLLYFIQGSMYSCEVSELVQVTHQLANTHYICTHVRMYVCGYSAMYSYIDVICLPSQWLNVDLSDCVSNLKLFIKSPTIKCFVQIYIRLCCHLYLS